MSSPNTQSCEAWLTISDVTYEGKTGSAKGGHAEMNALDIFFDDTTKDDKLAEAVRRLGRARKKSVYCPSKKCCIKCSAILQALGFSLEKDSHWSEEKMEPSEWGVSGNLQSLFKEMGIDYSAVKALA